MPDPWPAAALSAPAILVTELFPPAVGGSAVLFENVYSRIAVNDVLVLTDRAGQADFEEQRGNLRIRHRATLSTRWGVVHPAGLAHHLKIGRLIRAMTTGRPAVVHCGRALPEGLQAMFATWSSGHPYVCWTHGEELAYASTSRELTFLIKSVFRRAAAVCANSVHTARMLEALGVAQRKIRVVYPGVDSTRFHPALDATALRQRLAGDDEILVMSVGRLQRRKGHDLMIEALASLRDLTPRLRYVIVGDGDERGRLESLVRAHRLDDRVRFEGEVAPRDLSSYFAACDVFAMPNRVDGVDVEGFGIVFLEAAACGRPVIGGNSGGVPEAIDAGNTGLLVSGTDAGELAGAVATLARSRDLRQRMGRAGRARVERRFSWERAAADVTDLHCALAAAS